MIVLDGPYASGLLVSWLSSSQHPVLDNDFARSLACEADINLVSEDEARAYAKECGLPIVSCCCSACGDLGLQRQRVKRLIFDLEREHGGVKASMLRALANVTPAHLLDPRLYPLAEQMAESPLGPGVSRLELL